MGRVLGVLGSQAGQSILGMSAWKAPLRSPPTTGRERGRDNKRWAFTAADLAGEADGAPANTATHLHSQQLLPAQPSPKGTARQRKRGPFPLDNQKQTKDQKGQG